MCGGNCDFYSCVFKLHVNDMGLESDLAELH